MGPGGIWGQVQDVGQVPWVNTRPLICWSLSARSSDASEAHFIGEYVVRTNLVEA